MLYRFLPGQNDSFVDIKIEPDYSFSRMDPFFDNIRAEPEFQQIVRDVDGKYQAEHERVRQWLEENELL